MPYLEPIATSIVSHLSGLSWPRLKEKDMSGNKTGGNTGLGILVGAMLVLVAGIAYYLFTGGDVPPIGDEPEIQIDLPDN